MAIWNKNRAAVSVAVLVTASITGCGAVYTTSPVGDTPTQLVAEDWNGTWFSNEETLSLWVSDEMKGTLEAAWLEREKGELKTETIVAHVRTWQDWMFLSIEDRDEEGQLRYAWGRIKKDHQQIILWGPDLEKFKMLVNKEKLPGRVDGDDVFLDELRPEDLELIRNGDEGMALDWENPLVLIRIGQWVEK